MARVVEPDLHTAPVYADLYEIYHRLYRHTREEMHRLAERFG